MRTVGVLPVKRFDRAKQRLAPTLGPDGRALLAEAMLRDVLVALGAAQGLEAVVMVTAEPRARALARLHGLEALPDPAEAGQSAAAAIGVEEARARGADRVLLVPGDCPALDSVEVDALLQRGEAAPSVAVVPDRHRTGTNALLLAPAGVIEPAFGPGSLGRHLKLAERSGVTATVAEVPSLLLDADTPEDLAELRVVLARGGRRAATLSTLEALEQGRPVAFAGG